MSHSRGTQKHIQARNTICQKYATNIYYTYGACFDFKNSTLFLLFHSCGVQLRYQTTQGKCTEHRKTHMLGTPKTTQILNDPYARTIEKCIHTEYDRPDIRYKRYSTCLHSKNKLHRQTKLQTTNNKRRLIFVYCILFYFILVVTLVFRPAFFFILNRQMHGTQKDSHARNL